MNDKITTIMNVNENEIRVMRINDEDYISLTDLARYKNPNDPSDVIKKWLSNYDTIEFLGLWEELSNEDFNSAEFSLIKNEAPKRSFTMTPSQWCTRVNAIGMTYSKGKYSVGTFAHSDIALEFASWIDNLFKIYLIKEFKRLKYNESYQEKIEWSVRRSLSKTNYRIHTDSIKENIVPKLTEKQKQFVYANEADVINVALFGMTAGEWRKVNPNLEGNIRDYADILHLIVLSNLEVLNANMIDNNVKQSERLEKLNATARKELSILSKDKNVLGIEKLDEKLIDTKKYK
ncbi:MAG: KilA-N domain-containing protein [Bacilli bacterium]|nr:KilA-N domain-containing protein [Bacilli bacterium]